MAATQITVKDGNHQVTAAFVKSEDAGYSAGRLLLDLPSGATISIKKSGRNWIEARIENNVCRRSVTHTTKAAALQSAAFELLSETVELDSLV